MINRKNDVGIRNHASPEPLGRDLAHVDCQ